MLLTTVNQYLEQKSKNTYSAASRKMNGNGNNREQLQQELGTTQDQVASIIESFVELGVSIYDFPGTPEATKGMITNLQRNVDRLYKLNVRSNDPQSGLSKVDIPLEVVQYIEDGRNPDIYTREFVEAIRRSNQYQRGKMHGLKQLRDSLADKIVDEFPELQKPVEDIIKRTSPIDDSSTAHQ